MKFFTRPMPEYSLSRQRRDYEGKHKPPTSGFQANNADALPAPHTDATSPRSPTYLSQHQSILLSRLPIETRLQIWQHAIGNQKLHIVNKYRRLGHAVVDEEYWRQHHAERPDLRASSWMFTYGSLPTTKQLADDSLCDLLVTCRQVYHEAETILYSTNTFAFWDLRTVATFKRCIPGSQWAMLRSVEVYAMYYRKEDDDHAVEARNLLQLEAWPSACDALATLPNLRRLRIYLANPLYMDKNYLLGRRRNIQNAVLEFLKEIKFSREQFELCVAKEGREKHKGQGNHWRVRGISADLVNRLEAQLQLHVNNE